LERRDAPITTAISPSSARSTRCDATTDAPPRLRIAFVVHDYNRHGGQNRYVAELATRFKRAHEVHVFANSFEDSDPQGVVYRHVPAVRKSALASALSFVVPATLLARGAFDVIHSQGLCGLAHNFATAHMCQSAWFRALETEGIALDWRQRTFRALVAPLERRALCQPATRRVVAVSERVKADLAEHYGRRAEVDVIYHGTDTETFHPDNSERFRAAAREELGIPKSAFVALYVGDLKKGAAAAIRAVARTPGVVLVLRSASDAAAAKQVALQENAADRMLFRPHSKSVERDFAAADVFLFPTVYDSFGMVVAEAMASGLPVIVSASAGAAELIDSGVDGFVTRRPWDVPTIADRLAELRDDAGLRERMGLAARRRIEPLTWDRTAAATMQAYARMLTT
jgi:UDP-glucose:(heptosyl)LPS alpha-1,3-glucosyltransferase